MVEELLPNLYRIEVPLPHSPLKVLNSYVLKGEGRFLVVDTGMNRDECKSAMIAGLEKLGVDLNKTDFFITHLHVDHSGLVGTLATETSTVYFNEIEGKLITRAKTATRWPDFYYGLYHASGFPESEFIKAVEGHPGRRWGSKRQVDYHFLKEGGIINIGDYSLRCIETPGHSPGHLCLYEADHKVLVSGDHILFDITPNITYWPELNNALRDYLASLEKVYDLDVNLILPGHRSLMNDHRKRIRELQEHHQARLNEILVALRDGEKDAYEISPHITWDVTYDKWEDFPSPQKWFAFGETLAHLIYLEGEGRVRRNTRNGRITFSLVES